MNQLVCLGPSWQVIFHHIKRNPEGWEATACFGGREMFPSNEGWVWLRGKWPLAVSTDIDWISLHQVQVGKMMDWNMKKNGHVRSKAYFHFNPVGGPSHRKKGCLLLRSWVCINPENIWGVGLNIQVLAGWNRIISVRAVWIDGKHEGEPSSVGDMHPRLFLLVHLRLSFHAQIMAMVISDEPGSCHVKLITPPPLSNEKEGGTWHQIKWTFR